jgi:hypothetical protein
MTMERGMLKSSDEVQSDEVKGGALSSIPAQQFTQAFHSAM